MYNLKYMDWFYKEKIIQTNINLNIQTEISMI